VVDAHVDVHPEGRYAPHDGGRRWREPVEGKVDSFEADVPFKGNSMSSKESIDSE